MYIRCCIWYNTWCWTYSLNWELVTMIFFSRDSSYLYVWVNHIFVTVNSDDMSKMETVSYTTDYFQSLPCFKWKLRKTWFLLKRMDCNESWKSLSPQLLFRVSLSRFHFVSALQHLDNRYAVKQTSSLYLKFSLVPPFFSCFCCCCCCFCFLERLVVLNLYIPEYLSKISPREEMKEAFFWSCILKTSVFA